MAETRSTLGPRLGWQPLEGKFSTPIYFEGEELPGGAPAPAVVSPAEDASATAAAGETAPIDTGEAPPPPWEGKTPEELWNRNGELIKENTSYKERYRPWEQVTEGLAPEDVDFYRDFLGALKTGDQAKLSIMAPAMRQVLDNLTPAQQAKVADALEEAQEEFDPFDPAQIDKRIEDRAAALLDRRDQERQQRQAIEDAQREMNAKLADMAKPDSEGGVGIAELADPTTAEYATVLWMTKQDSELAAIGDPMERLVKAAQKYRDRLDERAQQLLKAKSTAAAVPASPQAGHAPSGSKAPRTMDEAKASGAARIEKLMRGTEQSVGT